MALYKISYNQPLNHLGQFEFLLAVFLQVAIKVASLQNQKHLPKWHALEKMDQNVFSSTCKLFYLPVILSTIHFAINLNYWH